MQVAGIGPAATPGDESPGWNHGKPTEVGSCSPALDPESAQADFVWFQRRIHSLLEGGPGPRRIFPLERT
jgi:hypothetical protein